MNSFTRFIIADYSQALTGTANKHAENYFIFALERIRILSFLQFNSYIVDSRNVDRIRWKYKKNICFCLDTEVTMKYVRIQCRTSTLFTYNGIHIVHNHIANMNEMKKWKYLDNAHIAIHYGVRDVIEFCTINGLQKLNIVFSENKHSRNPFRRIYRFVSFENANRHCFSRSMFHPNFGMKQSSQTPPEYIFRTWRQATSVKSTMGS